MRSGKGAAGVALRWCSGPPETDEGLYSALGDRTPEPAVAAAAPLWLSPCVSVGDVGCIGAPGPNGSGSGCGGNRIATLPSPQGRVLYRGG